VTSGVPQGSVLGLVLFNIFVGDMNSGIESTLRQFADNTNLCSAVDTLEGRDATQRDPERLQRWAHANLMKFTKAKCKILHLGWGNPKHKHRLGREWIESSPVEQDLGVLLDEKLNVSQQFFPTRVVLAQVAQRSCGCSLPGSVQGQAGQDLEQPGLVEGGWNQVNFKVPSNPNHSILMFITLVLYLWLPTKDLIH